MRETRMPQKQYVLKKGTHCPYCNSENIEGQHVEITDSGAEQEICCLDCDKEWFDFYKLAGYFPA